MWFTSITTTSSDVLALHLRSRLTTNSSRHAHFNVQSSPQRKQSPKPHLWMKASSLHCGLFLLGTASRLAAIACR